MRNDPRRPDELLTCSGIASMLDVSPSAVSNWRKRTEQGKLTPPFPQAWLEVNAPRAAYRIAVFVLSEVETWAAERAAIVAARNERNIARLESQLDAARNKSAAIAARARTESGI